jgi:endonuclease/exonuclease/phosphatase (EEP) superfamily protein YafD
MNQMFGYGFFSFDFIKYYKSSCSPYKYTSFHKSVQREPCDASSEIITVLSANVFQENLEYAKFTALVHKYNPDIVLTMESDENWKKALSVLDQKYKYNIK